MAPQREWFEKNYYETLGVAESATAKEITKAYRKLKTPAAPDANPGDAPRRRRSSRRCPPPTTCSATRPTRRVRRGPPPRPHGRHGLRPGWRRRLRRLHQFTTDDMGDLGDLFGGLFGRMGSRGGGRRPGASHPESATGSDLETELHLSFEDAIAGLETTRCTTSDAVCSTCTGTGAKPGTAPMTCPVCHGRGVTDDNQGLFSFSTPCAECAGRGVLIADPCPTCAGTGIERRPRDVKVRMPAGVRDGQKIRLNGRGSPGRNGGPAGDLYVLVHVMAHPLFGRDGDNLTLSVPVTFPEAVLGTKLTVPTLDGDSVTLKVPEGTRSGRTFRVKGRGVATKKSTGDLLVTVEVAVPTALTDEQRAAVEALAAATTESPRANLGV
ncbi:MAG: DnaJ C-terminal domain-containing protein [Acidimicrobiales bacterium]